MARLQSLHDKPNTARKYETTYILRPNLQNEGVAEINARVKGIIEAQNGTILKVDNWGKRRLAYECNKERKGIYLYWSYLGTPGLVEEIERNLRMLDNVIRYLSVKVDMDIDVAGATVEVDATTFERAATTAADEEDMFLKGAPGSDDGMGDDDDDEDDYNYDPGASSKSKADAYDVDAIDAEKGKE